MTIKAILQSYESQIVIVFAVLIGSIIAIKMISIFIAMSKQQPLKPSEKTATDTGNVEAVTGGTRAVINNYLVSDNQFALSGIDEKTAAIIVAVVANDSGMKVDELQFKSIKAIS